jgi:thiol-disulfide isomerase/thioredoxin
VKLVYFGGPWCPACADRQPVIEDIAAATGLELSKLDPKDADPELATFARDMAARLRVKACPTLVVVDRAWNRVAGFYNHLITLDAVRRVLRTP